LKKHQNYALEELDNLIPFEKEIYVGLLLENLEKERQSRQNG
jgi:hypothetical protein